MVDIQNALGHAPSAAIAQFEQTYGLRLPQDYRRFLSNHNGGHPSDPRFCITSLGEEALVHYFFGLDTPDIRGLRGWLDEYGREMPPGFLIIGGDPGANFIIMGTETSEAPGVYYWDHCYFFEASSDEENTYFLAASFTEFLDGLMPEA
jgi:hypothetical protein